MPKLVISGGGNATATQKIDAIYTSLLGGKKILYIPRAMYPDRYPSCLEWIQNVFPIDKGYTVDIVSAEDFLTKEIDYLNTYDGMYIGGGNTYRLLKLIKETGFSKIITQFLENNKPIYGGSAGAIIMGKEIHTSADINTVHLSFDETAGYNMCNNHSIACHYLSSSGADNEIREYSKNYDIPVLCLPEGTGIICDGDIYTIAGEKTAYLIDISGDKRELGIGEII